MPGSGILNIRTYRDRLLAEQDRWMASRRQQVAEALESHAADDAATARAKCPRRTAKELRLTLGDLTAMAHLGNYYAEKILGATDLALFDKTGKAEQQASAIKHLEAALDHWKKYAAVATRQYRPQLLTRIGYVDLNALTEQVRADVHMANQWKPQQ